MSASSLLCCGLALLGLLGLLCVLVTFSCMASDDAESALTGMQCYSVAHGMSCVTLRAHSTIEPGTTKPLQAKLGCEKVRTKGNK